MSKKPAPAVQPGGPMKPSGPAKGGGGGHHQPKAHHKRAHQKKPPRKFPGGVIVTKHPKAKRHPKHPRHPKRGLAGPALAGWWITGGNDQLDNCAAVAVANSLLLATGRRLPDAELLRLHDRAGPLSIPEALAALRPAKFKFWPESLNLAAANESPGCIAGLDTPHGPHAALLLGDALVTWGGVMDWPDDWLLDEAWEVTWPS